MGFTFGANQIEIEIEGKIYKIANTFGLDKKMSEVRKECIRYADEMDKTNSDNEDEIFDMFFGFARETIDELIGNHAFDNIFKARVLDVYEVPTEGLS